MSTALEHILNKINEAQLIQDPWPYLFIEEYVPESFYKKLCNETTSIHLQKNYDAYRGRTEEIGWRQIEEVANTWYDVSPTSLNYGGESLQEYCDAVSSKEVQSAISFKFADFLKKYGHSNEVNKSQDIVGVVTEYDVITTGWEYPIHSDIRKKLFTHLHYLAVEGDDESIGTRLYPNTGKGYSLDYDKDWHVTNISLLNIFNKLSFYLLKINLNYYDLISTGSSLTKKNLLSAFCLDTDKVVVTGLPRTDYILNVYPNPFNSSFTIQLPDNINKEIKSVRLVDLIGKSVFSTNQFTYNNKALKVSLQNKLLPSSLYYGILETNKRKHIFKLTYIQ